LLGGLNEVHAGYVPDPRVAGLSQANLGRPALLGTERAATPALLTFLANDLKEKRCR
jgi:hypothetical protein